MVKKIGFKNYKSFKERQTLELKPITILIGKNSSGKSAITKLASLIEQSLSGQHEAPVKWNNNANGVELGAEFEDLIYGRSKTGKLEIEIEDENEKLELIIGTEKGEPQIFSWKLNGVEKLYDSKFIGFHLDTQDEELKIKSLKLNSDYIGPFRISPSREHSESDIHSVITKVGYQGEDAYPILIQDGLKTLHPLLDKVSQWYENNFEGWGLKLNKDKAPFLQLEVTRDQGRININLKDVGQGMSQALPLVVKAFIEPEDSELTSMEQPELHLHPGAHGSLAELFVESLESGKKSYLIETHSQNFVLRLRRLIAENKYTFFTSDDLAIYYVDFNETKNASILKRINVNKEGGVDYWPDQVFNETLVETLALRNAQKASAKNAG